LEVTVSDPDDAHARGGQPARDERGLLDQRAAERGLHRQDCLGASVNGVDHRHRRHSTPGGAGRGELAVPEDGEVVSARAVRGGGDELGQRGQCT
jgi:hypothetical protein